MTLPWLTILGLTPIIGALVMCIPTSKGQAKAAGLLFALATLIFSVSVTINYLGGMNLAEQVPWIPAFGAHWALNLDGMGLVMVLLTAILTPVVLIAEWGVAERVGRWSPRAFTGLVLLLEGLCLFVFMAEDVLLFYLLFEATLLPMYFLIGGFGGARRGYAAVKFLLFGLAGGLVMLVSVIGVYVWSAQNGSPSYLISDLAALPGNSGTGWLLMSCFLIAFILKAPMVPVHTWLPSAAEEATPGTSVLMVGVMDKIGTFGMIKICLAIFPVESQAVAPAMITLALISIIYGALAAIGAKNLLRLVAYTSISHFGFMVLGIYTFTSVGVSGSIFYMVNHGFSTAALFLVLGFLINRGNSAKVASYGGVQKVAPVLAGFLLLAGLSSLALPGMSSFVSEFMVMAGTWSRIPWVAVISALGTVLAAVYILLMYQRTMTGPLPPAVREAVATDLNLRERAIGGFLVAVILLLGFVPNLALSVIEPTAQHTVQVVGVADPVPEMGGE
ncbi:MAG: NADH-quinone oxidoreductase subunit M [Propionibacteriaceae bacterium]|jgi:NADH-quinone oxidoreductase subunit M|nr:NADH-quinone oxidoreductase subunit M [Propionibacteriaceae bacterium]